MGLDQRTRLTEQILMRAYLHIRPRVHAAVALRVAAEVEVGELGPALGEPARERVKLGLRHGVSVRGRRDVHSVGSHLLQVLRRAVVRLGEVQAPEVLPGRAG